MAKVRRPGEIGSVVIKASDAVYNPPSRKRVKSVYQELTPRTKDLTPDRHDYQGRAPASPTIRPRGSILGRYDIESEETWVGADGRVPQIDPTSSSNPMRPRTLRAGYIKERGAAAGTLWVIFRDGTPWEYEDVPPNVWKNFRRVKSPGRFINRVLNQYDYHRGAF